MPVHDWTRVEHGIFHHFHHQWIAEICEALNESLLPPEYYALAEQYASGFGPDVLTLKGPANGDLPPAGSSVVRGGSGNGSLLLAPPPTRLAGETEMEHYRRKTKVIAVRHRTGDDVVAMVEIVSPGNKSGRGAFLTFVKKAADLIEHNIHLLIIDILPPGIRDPQGVHAAIWEEIAAEPYTLPEGKPLTLASYEVDIAVRAYVEHVAVGDPLPDMPLFLEPGGHVMVPLEKTYMSAFHAVPRRWREVLE